jgi:hypothetical protein
MGLRIRMDFFENKKVKRILKEKDGATMIIIYLKLEQGMSVHDEDEHILKRSLELFKKIKIDLKEDGIIKNYNCDIERNRSTPEYKTWRTKVYLRDNYTCCSCGAVGGKLNAHHIIRWADNKSNRYDVDNGVTLCVKCHKLAHKAVK